jgi:hypothetical protein
LAEIEFLNRLLLFILELVYTRRSGVDGELKKMGTISQSSLTKGRLGGVRKGSCKGTMTESSWRRAVQEVMRGEVEIMQRSYIGKLREEPRR